MINLEARFTHKNFRINWSILGWDR